MIVRQTNFGGGEFSPSLYGADDLREYLTGARTLRNFLPSKHRTAHNRPGLIHCHEVKDSTKPTRLLPFNFSDDQSYVVEVGDRNFRIGLPDGSLLAAPGLLAMGTNKRRSTDGGATWSDPAGAFPFPTVYALCEGKNGRIIAVGSDALSHAVVSYSDDLGASWTSASVPASQGALRAVAANGRRLVAFASGTTYAVLVSDDNGATWTKVGDLGSNLVVYGAAWGMGRFIAVGYAVVSGNDRARYSYSYDGVTWSAPVAIGNLDSSYTQSYLFGVTFCAGQFLAVGRTVAPTAQALLSQIGVLSANWKWTTPEAGSAFYGVASDGLKALAVGSNGSNSGIAYSFDSSTDTWTAEAPPAGWFYQAATFSRGYFVAIGGDATHAHCSRWSGSAWTTDPTVPNGDYRTIAPGKGTEIVEVATPYDAAMGRDLVAIQSGDIETIFHKWFPPKELRRYGQHDWRLADWYRTPPTLRVAGLAFDGAPDQTGDATHPPKAWSWLVTWEDEQTGVESLACPTLSPSGSGKIVLYPDKPVKLKWDLLPKARRYFVYRGRNALWGYVGTVEQPDSGTPATVYFEDDGQLPIYSDSPPKYVNPFQSDLAYPRAGCYLDDRLVVGGSLIQPATLKLSAVSDYHDFDLPIVTDPADSLEFTLSTRRFEEIRWVVPLERLIIGTSEGEWVIGGAGPDEPIAADSIIARERSARGSESAVQPVVVGEGVVYAQAGGRVLRDFAYRAENAEWGGIELSLLSGHLLQNRRIVDMAYAKEPHSTVWIVTDDGALLSCTFVREDKLWGFARHDSGGGFFEAVTVIPDGDRGEDVPFFVVKRTVQGSEKRFVERLASRFPAAVEDAIFFDSAAEYHGAPVLQVSGLLHLAGVTVGVLADGVYVGEVTVSSEGVLDLPGELSASDIVMGRAVESDFEALDYPKGRTKEKIVETVAVEYRLDPVVSDPGAGLQIGQDFDNLSDIRRYYDEPAGMLRVTVDTSNNPGGRCAVRNSQPFPVEILAVTREVR